MTDLNRGIMNPEWFEKRSVLRAEVFRWVVLYVIPAALVLLVLTALAAVLGFFFPIFFWLAHLLLLMTLSLCGIGIVLVIPIELLDKLLWKLFFENET